jgi:hypothetical protein
MLAYLPDLQAAFAAWDYCYASASLLFGMSTRDSIADRIREAIEASGDGLSKSQIRRLFHGHVEGNRIDAALEPLVALGALTLHSEPTGGRPSTHWSAIEKDEHEENEESVTEDEAPAEDRQGLFALLAHFFLEAMKQPVNRRFCVYLSSGVRPSNPRTVRGLHRGVHKFWSSILTKSEPPCRVGAVFNRDCMGSYSSSR